MRISDWSSDVCSSDLFAAKAIAPKCAPTGSIRFLAALRRLQARRQRLGATAVAVLADQPEVDLALLQAGREHHDAGAVAQAVLAAGAFAGERLRWEEHTSELQSLMRNSYSVFILKKKTRVN